MFIPKSEPNPYGVATKWDVPINTWLGVKFEQGLHDRAGAALSRAEQDLFASGPEIPADEANKRYGIPGDGGLVFDSPIKEERARLMRQRKEEELLRLSYFNAAEHSWLSPKAAAGLGAQLVGGIAHPLDLLITSLPFVGSTTKAAGLARVGASSTRQAWARGLIAAEEIPTLAKLPRFGPLVVEGMMQNAALEIPLYFQNMRDQAIYGPEDAALNIVAGGVFTAGLHAAARGVASLTKRTKDLMFRKAATDFLEDRPPDVDGIARMDENALRLEAERVIAAEDATRQPIKTGPIERPFDILDAIEGVGAIRSKRHAGPGSEGYYTDIYDAISQTGIGRKLFSARGQSPDSMADALRREGLLPQDATVADMFDAIDSAIKARRAAYTGKTPEAQAVRFYNALEDQQTKKTSHVVTVSDLNIGDSFKLAGENFRVTEIDPDTGAVTVQDGKKFGAQTLPEGAELVIDSGTLKQTPGGIQARLASVEFLTAKKREQRVREWIDAKKKEMQTAQADRIARAEQAASATRTDGQPIPENQRAAVAALEKEIADLERQLSGDDLAALAELPSYRPQLEAIQAATPCVLQALTNP